MKQLELRCVNQLYQWETLLEQVTVPFPLDAFAFEIAINSIYFGLLENTTLNLFDCKPELRPEIIDWAHQNGIHVEVGVVHYRYRSYSLENENMLYMGSSNFEIYIRFSSERDHMLTKLTWL